MLHVVAKTRHIIWQNDYYHLECLGKCKNCSVTFKKLDDASSLCPDCNAQVREWFDSKEYQRELQNWKNERCRQQKEISSMFWKKLRNEEESFRHLPGPFPLVRRYYGYISKYFQF